MSPHSPSGQLLHPVVGVEVRIMVVRMISIEPAKCGEPRADVMFVGEVIRATFKPLQYGSRLRLLTRPSKV